MDPKNSPRDRVDYQETPEDLTDVHAPTQREHSDPTADVTPMPTWLTAVCGLAVATGAFYLGSFHGGFRGDVFNERMSSPDMIWKQDLTQASIKSGSDIIAAGGGETLAAAGAKVYAANCAACHQAL